MAVTIDFHKSMGSYGFLCLQFLWGKGTVGEGGREGGRGRVLLSVTVYWIQISFIAFGLKTMPLHSRRSGHDGRIYVLTKIAMKAFFGIGAVVNRSLVVSLECWHDGTTTNTIEHGHIEKKKEGKITWKMCREITNSHNMEFL